MKVENLAYPWREDYRELQHEIEILKQNLLDLKMQYDNLKVFSQQLYDRLNIANSLYNSSPVQRPY